MQVPLRRALIICRTAAGAAPAGSSAGGEAAITMRGVASQAAGSARAPVAVVGGGLTGAAAAAALTKAGLSVHVYDMGRQPGGRATSRPGFDIGVQVIPPPSNPRYAAVLQDWGAKGLVAPWADAKVGRLDASTGLFTSRQEGSTSAAGLGQSAEGLFGHLEPASAGPMYVGLPNNGSLVKGYLSSLPNLTLHTSSKVAAATLKASDGLWHLAGSSYGPNGPQGLPGGPFSALVVADSLPAKPGSPGFMEVQLEGAGLGQEQAQIRKAMQRLESVPRTPLFTLMVRFPRQPAQQPLLPFSAASVVGSADIAWLCMDSAKPGREAQEAGAGSHDALIAITTPTLARTLLGTKEDGSLPPQTPEYLAERAQAVWAAVQPLLTKARGGIPPPEPEHVAVHRWGSAYSSQPLGEPCLAVPIPAGSPQGGSSSNGGATNTAFVLAGDFCLGAGVERAVLSGLAAADAVVGALAAV